MDNEPIVVSCQTRVGNRVGNRYLKKCVLGVLPGTLALCLLLPVITATAKSRSVTPYPSTTEACIRVPFLEAAPGWLKKGGPDWTGDYVRGQIVWTNSGVGLPGGDFLVVDLFQRNDRRLTHVAVNGVLSARMDSLSQRNGIERSMALSYIHSTDDGGYLVLDDSSPPRIMMFNSNELLDSEIALEEEAFRNLPLPLKELGANLNIAAWRAVPMGEDGALAFMDFQSRETLRSLSAFVYIDRDGGIELFEPENGSIEKHVRQIFLEDFSYLTSIGDVGYVLIMDETPWIGTIRRGSPVIAKLANFPQDFRRCPRLERNPEWDADRPTRVLMAAWQHFKWSEQIRDTSMAVGLYSWNGKLLLLTKDAASRIGETAWWLLDLDKRTGGERSRLRLPTRSPHINLIVGDTFGIIEKGPLEVVGSPPGEKHFRLIDSMVLFSSDWLAVKSPPKSLSVCEIAALE